MAKDFGTGPRWKRDNKFNINQHYDYIHSDYNTFIYQAEKNNIEESVKTSLVSLEKSAEKYLKMVGGWYNIQIADLRKQENIYIEKFFKSRRDRNEVLEILNAAFLKDHNKSNKLFKIKIAKTELIIKRSNIKNSDDAELKKIATDGYREQLKEIKVFLKWLINVYEVNQGISGADHKTYGTALSKIKSMVDIDLKGIENMTSGTYEEFAEIYKILLDNQINKYIGVLSEINVATFLKILFKGIDITVSGASDAGTLDHVADNIITVYNDKGKVEALFGINIKTTPKQYKLKRVNKIEDMYKDEKFIKNVTMGKKDQKKLLYLLRNQIATSQYCSSGKINIAQYSEHRALINEIISIEKRLSEFYNLSSVLDGYFFQKELTGGLTDPLVHSILLFYPEGFFWTSDIMEYLVKNFDKRKGLFSTEILTKMDKNRINMGTELEKLYLSKKEIIKEDSKINYAKLHDKFKGTFSNILGDSSQLSFYSLIDEISYTIQLKNITKKMPK